MNDPRIPAVPVIFIFNQKVLTIVLNGKKNVMFQH